MKHSLLITGLWLFSIAQSNVLAHEAAMAATASAHTMEHVVYYGGASVVLFALVLFLKMALLRRGWPGAKR